MSNNVLLEYAPSTTVPIDPDSGLFIRRWVRWFQQMFLGLRSVIAVDVEFANLPANLGREDGGSLFHITDYNHLLQWTGSAWQAPPGETLGGYKVVFVVGPVLVAGWHLCDGSTVSYLKADGTLGTIALPTEADTWFRI